MGPCNGVTFEKNEKKRFRKIDIHTHIIPEEWPDWNQKFGYQGWLTINHDNREKVNLKFLPLIIIITITKLFRDQQHFWMGMGMFLGGSMQIAGQ